MISQNTTLAPPVLPYECPLISTDSLSLQQNLDYLKNLVLDTQIQDAIISLIDHWTVNPSSIQPLTAIRNLIDKIRLIPRSEKRLIAMNTFVKTLGKPDFFATLLDMLQFSSKYAEIDEQALSEISRKSSKHAVYGWCGQTRLALSGTEKINSTLVPAEGVQDFLGKTPTSAWSLSMHIWQPNPNARGFLCGRSEMPNIIAEPPHSHPFDFASVVVTGEMHQSIYAQQKSDQTLYKNSACVKGRYDGIELEHVHGVWPPHDYREQSYVVALENRVAINTGDSYFMSADMIHDVQIDANIAQHRPAITLFLRAESFIKPHVYMAAEMADFHEANPYLKNQGYPLEETDWHHKLKLVSDYVRGKSATLNLSNIVKYDSDYAFFHI